MANLISVVANYCVRHLNGSVYNDTLQTIRSAVNDSQFELVEDLVVPIPPLTKTETFLHIIFISQVIFISTHYFNYFIY